MKMRLSRILIALLLVGGCQQHPPRVAAPNWDPQQIAARVIEQLDSDGDATIDLAEAKNVPGLVGSFNRLDTDQDHRLNVAEVQARFELYEKMRTGLVAKSFIVLLNGRPIADAKVELVPEEFQGGVTQAAHGVTDRSGYVVPQTVDQDKPAMQIGFYRVLLYPADSPEGLPLTSRSPVGVEVSPVYEANESGTTALRFES